MVIPESRESKKIGAEATAVPPRKDLLTHSHKITFKQEEMSFLSREKRRIC